MAKGYLRKKGDMWYTTVAGIEQKASKNKAEANRILRDRLNEYEDTGIVFKPSRITLEAALQEWLKECCIGQRAENTIIDYEHVIRNMTTSGQLKGLRLVEVTPDLLQQYVNEKAARYSESHMRSEYSVMNPFFKWCVYPKQYIKDTPFQYIKKTRKSPAANIDLFSDLTLESDSSVPVVSQEEFKQILDIFILIARF